MTNNPHDLDTAIAQHYAKQQEGLPPPLEPHPGYATLIEAWTAHQRWLIAERKAGRLPAPVPVALPD